MIFRLLDTTRLYASIFEMKKDTQPPKSPHYQASCTLCYSTPGINSDAFTERE